MSSFVRAETPDAYATKESIMVRIHPANKVNTVSDNRTKDPFKNPSLFRKVYTGGEISDIFETKHYLVWLEQTVNEKKLCSVSKRRLKKDHDEGRLAKPFCQMTSINGVHDLQVLGLDHAWDDKGL